ncbi:hypothetical protein NA57DRAFT_74341 [Rhizodiscina lignyota]|uniref:RING-type domain-containing protein n=1 Tax=Rhizodiscina lignyota TaxID=1504668 RepID=A0A9P4IIS5_9PEZI|nr:hypothetical protein NA57DRAFT_74341 [Rhizodiscina lignyota]
MGTLTADIPIRPEYCAHKLPTSCRLTSTPLCCACADRRPHSSSYRVYIDGVGFVFRGTRWQSYCWFCKVFWDNRIADAAIEISRTRIPDHPNQEEWLEHWYEWHRGYKVVHRADGQEERIRLQGEALKDAEPGTLPRSLNELRGDRFGFDAGSAQRSNEPVPVEEAAMNDGPSLEETLDELIEAVDAEDSQSTRRPDATPNTRNTDTPGEQYPARVMSDVERLNERIAEARVFLTRAREQRDSLSAQLEAKEGEVLAKEERLRRLERDKRRMENFARVFGTREEIERQGDAYESPIGSMFARAYTRYRQAEQDRQAAATLGEHLEQADVPTNVEVPGTLTYTAPGNEAATGDSNARPSRPDYPDSQLLRDQLAVIRQLSGDSARIRSELSAIRQLSAGAGAAPPTSAPASDSAQPTTAPPSSRSALRSMHDALLSDIRTRLDSPASENRDAASYLISHLRSTTAEAEALVSAINSWDRIRESRLAPPPDQTIGLDVSDDRPEPKSEEAMMVKLSCQVCYTQTADTAVLPCGHLAMCRWCADMAVPGRANDWTQPARGAVARCPVCREKVKKRVRIFAVTQ